MNSGMNFLIVVALQLLISCSHPECELEEPPINTDTLEDCRLPPAPIYNPGEPTFGLVSGLKNCRPFAASAQGTWLYRPDSLNTAWIIMRTYETWPGGFLADKEFVLLSTIADGVGKWPILPNPDPLTYQQTYYINQDHHELEAFYKFDTSYSGNYLNITRIDSASGHMEGVFTIQFYRSLPTPGNPNSLHPDTVRFEDCHFVVSWP